MKLCIILIESQILNMIERQSAEFVQQKQGFS